MKKVVSITCVLALIFCMFLSDSSVSLAEKHDSTILPEVEAIKEKQHFNNLSSLKEKNKVNEYIDALGEKDLLLAIAECAEELDRMGAYGEMALFAKYADEKLIDYLQENEYIEIIEHPDYSDSFKIFMIDAYCYSKKKNHLKNSGEFNSILKKIIKDKQQSSALRFYSIKKVDNFDTTDIELLKEITNNEKDNLKGAALKALKRINEIEAYFISKSIVKNHNEYSSIEINTAMKILADISDDIFTQTNENDTRVKDIENILKVSNETSVTDCAIYSLGDIKHIESVEAVVNNIQKIKDDSLIRYYVDKNYLTVERMLNKMNDINIIKTALVCVDIAPYRNFLPALKALQKECGDEYVREQVQKLIVKVNNNSYTRNVKWDNY